MKTSPQLLKTTSLILSEIMKEIKYETRPHLSLNVSERTEETELKTQITNYAEVNL